MPVTFPMKHYSMTTQFSSLNSAFLSVILIVIYKNPSMLPFLFSLKLALLPNLTLFEKPNYYHYH
jgi:hypothetical protein